MYIQNKLDEVYKYLLHNFEDSDLRKKILDNIDDIQFKINDL